MRPVLEHIPSNSQQSFYLGQYNDSTFNAPWHYHPQWELTYIIEGSGTAYTGNAIRHFSAGELCLIGPNVSHCWKSYQGRGDSAKSLFIQWDEQLLGENWIAGREFKAIAKLLEDSQNGLSFDRELSLEIGRKLCQFPEQSPFERLINLLGILQQLASSPRQRLAEQVTPQQMSGASKRIDAILEFVAEHYQTKISADDMANLTNMTTVSFSKYFKRTFNKTFTNYLNEYRISRACALLIQDEHNVEEVAFRCGYNNMAFFHRQFRQQIGQTPLQYRKQYHLLSQLP
ncbi:AraC family transcriptional regulator [Aliagarivorans marinus]|uniref:AraC family transcriptional regulator n=1 Tax=Aliagarivorans marinus TaxID=561965 RepID=UPI000A06B632|nr:AraC family transcriptional regulator [Aliagarivorans marinus]